MNAREIVKKLESLKNPENIAGIKSFGITPKAAFGVSVPALKEIAKDVKSNRKTDTHWLWNCGRAGFTKRELLLI